MDIESSEEASLEVGGRPQIPRDLDMGEGGMDGWLSLVWTWNLSRGFDSGVQHVTWEGLPRVDCSYQTR